MFAVIKTGGKQYRVAAEDILQIERISGEVGDIVQIGDVLAHGAGDDVTFGAPFIDGASVAAEVIEQGRAKTVIAFKKRRRQNSRRKQGHRQLLTTVRISEILTGGAKPSKKAKGKPAAAKDAAPKTDKAKAEAPVETPVEAGTEAPAAGKAKAAKGDDLTAIKGIGPKAAEQLAEQGVTSYADLAGLDDERIAEIDEAMPFSADQINDWRDQAKELTK